MDFNELVRRYNTGETDLIKETTFIYNEQGKNAAYDFARTIDEVIGSGAYNVVMAQISKLETLGKMPQINQKAIIAGELVKQARLREIALKQIEQEQLAKNLQDNKNPKMKVIDEVKAPIWENDKPETGLNPNWKEKPQGNGDIFVPAFEMSKTNILLILGVLLIVLGFIFSQKK
jgi:hypothetical protein